MLNDEVQLNIEWWSFSWISNKECRI